MKNLIIKCVTIVLAFMAGAGFMSYATSMGNHDMTAVMAEATLPVVYAEKDGQMYNEMHGYAAAMNGSYMKDSILGLSEDHSLGLAVEKYNAGIQEIGYEVRSLDMERLIESSDQLSFEDDGKYLHLELNFKDLMEPGEKYLFILKVLTDNQKEVFYYSQLSYLGENHVEECVEFARQFHEAAFQKDTNHELLSRLEPESGRDSKNLGYVNIHSYPRTVVWGEMPVEQISGTEIRFTDFNGDKVSLVMDYQMRNPDTGEIYQVSEAFCVQYTSSRMYLQNYERTADRIFVEEGQLVKDGEIHFGIQSRELNYRINEEENVLAFVQQGQLWSYDFGQNRLSLVYGYQNGDDRRGSYDAHDFRILDVEDSGNMNFLVYGYMNRGYYEGMCGVLLCHYDALLNTVEEQFFIPSDRPYQVLKEEIGRLAVENEDGLAWLSYRGMILQINLEDTSVQVLAEGVGDQQLQVSDSGLLVAWTDNGSSDINLLNTRTGIINQIMTESGEVLQVLGFMEEDFIYGAASQEDIWTDIAGRRMVPMNRVVIRDHSGNEVREFDYAVKGKYVTGVTIEENRIDLTCVTRTADGSFEETLPEPITYTIEPVDAKLKLETVYDEIKRNEYRFAYEGTLKSGSMKRPKVKMVLFENNRTIQIAEPGMDYYLAWTFDGGIECFDTLSEAVQHAYTGMGAVWKDGFRCFWERWRQQTRVQLDGFDSPDGGELSGDSVTQCMQLIFRQRQIYTDVQACREEGMDIWEIFDQELGDSSCLLPGCSVSMILYYIDKGEPVMVMKNTGQAVLIVGYDQQNIVYYEPGQAETTRAGLKDSTAMFEEAGNLFFTCLP